MFPGTPVLLAYFASGRDLKLRVKSSEKLEDHVGTAALGCPRSAALRTKY